jgi:D-alanyl-D-alanine carboxypeptidase (penicillin-binding protein 5/6)
MSTRSPHWARTRLQTKRRPRTRATTAVAIGALLIAVGTAGAYRAVAPAGLSSAFDRALRVDWPPTGQSAVATSSIGLVGASGGSTPAPIASVAKVMTAYVVLTRYPLKHGEGGFSMRVDADDVADTEARRHLGQSLLPVHEGQVLSERDALVALLLPSANNIAAMLAKSTYGTEAAFVRQMNSQAKRLGMGDTTYTDPSGFEPSTVSTAVDQLKLAVAAMTMPVLADLVSRTTIELADAGEVSNTDTLLGTDGFVGIKTGSHDAAGGCFMFQSEQSINGRSVAIVGVVLGQPGIDAALAAARAIVDGLRAQLGRAA